VFSLYFHRLIVLLGMLPAFAWGADPAPAEIIERAGRVQWGAVSVQGQFEMTLVRPDWSRSVKLEAWVLRNDNKSFYRVLAPAKEAGTSTLSIGTEMWSWVPALERTIKIPPALALQPWMGSDITNDDVMQQANRIAHYEHHRLDDLVIDGKPAYQVELKPKPDAPVAWERVVHVVRKADFVPVSESYYDARGTLLRQMLFSDVRAFGTHAAPARWEARPADKPGQSTVITVLSAEFDKVVPDDVFSLRHLSRKR
jgi:outer membrane lipoprotein-sorting protein